MPAPIDRSWPARAVRLGLLHAGVGVCASLVLAVGLANSTPPAAPRVVGPCYDPGRLGVWLEERTAGRRTVMFMLARSRIYADGPGGPRLVEPRPERRAPGWSTDWSRRIPALQASGVMVDPTQAFDHGFGWPAPCLASSEYLAAGAGGRVTVRSEGVAAVGGVRVPARVLGAGLVLDAALLGTPASVAVVTGALVRARWRRSRKLCPACAYPADEGFGTCPECGREGARRAA